MSAYKNLLLSIPEIKGPTKKQNLKQRMLWTFGILILFLFLASVPLFGVDASQASQFKQFELLLGAKIGKLLTLGIGPIVTASIILQLLKGAGILNFNMNTENGKLLYHGTHKFVTFLFILIEAFVYVKFGAVTASNGLLSTFWLLVAQLALGGFIVFYMDEVVKKWGIGSGVSLFIAAGIGQAVAIQTLSPLAAVGGFAWPFGGSEVPVGILWQIFYALSFSDMSMLVTSLIKIGVTVGLFFVIVFLQSVNVEIPLSFGRVRGQSIKWPLNFFYAGVIPIILVSALTANFNLIASFTGSAWFGNFVSYISPFRVINHLGDLFTLTNLFHFFSYLIFMVFGATLFSYFWVQSGGQDSKSQAKSIINSGLQIPGFRKDERIVERVLSRYIGPLTILGGIGIGIVAFTADALSALTSGTGILLMIMIIYQFYKQVAKESMDDFAVLKKFMRK